MKLAFALMALAATNAKVYFQETFDNMDAWTHSEVEKFDGKFELTSGKWYGDKAADQGLKTTQDAHFYATSAPMEVFDNTGKDFVLQFSVKHEQKIDCGGGYIKVFPKGLEGKKLDGDSKYSIMFGPDICGYSTKKVHAIINYKGKNHLITKEVTCETDELTHVYTFIIHADNTYEIKIDGESKQKGSLKEDWDMLGDKMIKDPEASKPEDWVDEAMMDDPEDVKPAGWDDIAEQIADPEAEMPEDWDVESDGEWEAPMIDNPEYKGEWSAKRIDNPEYKGEWVHPQVANPEYVHDDALYDYSDFGVIGFDLWQVKAGTIFDNVLITDDEDEAKAGVEAFKKLAEGEKAAKKEADDKKAAEEEAKKAAEEEDKEEEEEEETEGGRASAGRREGRRRGRDVRAGDGRQPRRPEAQ
jgi:calreticulin